MGLRIAIMVGYLLVLLAIGVWARTRSRANLTDYFVASRAVSPGVLILTMAATNFSAFTVFGFAGAGWESGYAFYPIMAFGTGFMAVSFVWIGWPVHELGVEHGLITPAELLHCLTGSRTLQIVFFIVLTAFTLPYLAMQPMAAGYILEALLGIPYFAGAALVTGILLLYTFLGGFRGVSWTDAFQGGVMATLLLLAVGLIARSLGGLRAAHETVAGSFPGLMSRPGLDGLYTPGVWFGYLALWFLCDPLFPQLFQRFYAARGRRALATTMTIYPLLTGGLFLLPVTVGVLGRITFPTLPDGVSPDQIMPLMLAAHVSPVMEALVLTAALAALMSTLDSQLLTLSSMFVRDVWYPLTQRGASRRELDAAPREIPVGIGKGFVILLALVGLAIAYHPPASFRILATQTFTGLAVLFPALAATLYWKRMNRWAAVASILVGEGLVAVDATVGLPRFGTLSVIPIVAASAAVLLLGSLLFPSHSMQPPCPERPRMGAPSGRWIAVFALLFVLANDGWNWASSARLLLGYPGWVWWSLLLCVATAAAFGLWARALSRPRDMG